MTTTVTTDYVLADGQVIMAVDQTGVSIEGAAWRNVTLSGDVVVTAERDAGVSGVRAEAFDDQVAALLLTSTANVSVDTKSLNLGVGVSAAGDRAQQRQASDSRRRGEGELQRDRSAKRVTDHVSRRPPLVVHQRERIRRHLLHRDRTRRWLALSHAAIVEP